MHVVAQHPDPISAITSKEKVQSNVFACFIAVIFNLRFLATSLYIFINCRLKLGFIVNAKIPDSAKDIDVPARKGYLIFASLYTHHLLFRSWDRGVT